MTEIIKNRLFLGNMFDANNQVFINNNNITCILCVAERLHINNMGPNIHIYKYASFRSQGC